MFIPFSRTIPFQELAGRSMWCLSRVTALLLMYLLALAPQAATATTPSLGYAGAIGGTVTDLANGVAVDSAGNAYVTGYVTNGSDLDPGPGALTVTTTGIRAGFLCKLDTNGDLVWGKSFVDGTNIECNGIALDGAGGVYVAGEFGGTVDFDPGPGTFVVAGPTNRNPFVCKLDTDGNFQWVAPFLGTLNSIADAVAADAASGVCVTGGFVGTIDFDPGPGVLNINSSGSTDIFVVKLNTDGQLQWARTTGGSGNVRGDAVAFSPAGDVYTTGWFSGTTDFDPGAGVDNRTATGPRDTFINKLSAAGAVLWTAILSGPDYSNGREIAVDVAGHVYITGDFAGTVDFDPGPGAVDIAVAGGTDAFVSKLDDAGNLLWATPLGGIQDERGNGLALDGMGLVYLTGNFSDTVDFDPGAGTFDLTSGGQWDAYLCALSTDGGFRWAGAISSDQAVLGHGIAADSAGSAYGAGFFRSTTDFDPGPGTVTETATGNYDAYIVRFDPPPPPVANDDYGSTLADAILTSLAVPASNTVLDNDSGASLHVAAFDATSASGATVLVNPNGTFVYDPTGAAALQALLPGESLEDTFTYTATDGVATVTATVHVQVFGAGTALPARNLTGLMTLGAALISIGFALQKRYAWTKLRTKSPSTYP